MRGRLSSVQLAILRLVLTQGIENLTYQQIADEVGLNNRQAVGHHLNQLEKRGLIDLVSGRVARPGFSGGFMNVPILGLADCGQAKQLAEGGIRGYIKLSAGFVGQKQKGLFAVQAVGNSMDNAKFRKSSTDLGTKTIEDGDYLIIDPDLTSPENGDYVLSIIDGAANIKRFYQDREKIMLLSESTDDYPPIVIHPDDIKDYMVSGKVLDVIKKPNISGEGVN